MLETRGPLAASLHVEQAFVTHDCRGAVSYTNILQSPYAVFGIAGCSNALLGDLIPAEEAYLPVTQVP